MTTGKTIPLTRWTSVGKVMSLIFNMLSRLAITFFPTEGQLVFYELASIMEVLELYREEQQK